MKILKKKNKKRLLTILLIIIIISALIISYLIFEPSFSSTSKPSSSTSGKSKPVKQEPLSDEERQTVEQTVKQSEFVKDIPDDAPIAITFYSYKEGELIWRDTFLIGKNGFVTEGKPLVYLTLHSKYILDFKKDFCETINQANKNGDLGFKSDKSKAKLLWKYKRMLPHRECFGF